MMPAVSPELSMFQKELPHQLLGEVTRLPIHLIALTQMARLALTALVVVLNMLSLTRQSLLPQV